MIGRDLGLDEGDLMEIEYANPNQLTVRQFWNLDSYI